MSRRNKLLVGFLFITCLSTLTGNHFPNFRTVGAALRGRPVLRYASSFEQYASATNGLATEWHPYKSSARSGEGQTPPLPMYSVSRRIGPIRVDGRVDDLAWKRAPLVGDFVEQFRWFTEPVQNRGEGPLR